MMPRLAAKWRRQMEQEGGTYNSKNMSLPRAVNGRLTWEMRASELRAAQVPIDDGLPDPDRWARLEQILDA
ncbi:hypothetical protein ACWKT3_41195 [Streptomyces violaceus]